MQPFVIRELGNKGQYHTSSYTGGMSHANVGVSMHSFFFLFDGTVLVDILGKNFV